MSDMQIQPYLFFNGRCQEALEFYTATLGTQVEMMMRYKDSPEQPPAGMLPQGFEEKVMHCIAFASAVRGSWLRMDARKGQTSVVSLSR